MGETVEVIRAQCPAFACRIYRTKNGWPHQPWCSLWSKTDALCADCRYNDPDKDACDHPARGKHSRKRPISIRG